LKFFFVEKFFIFLAGKFGELTLGDSTQKSLFIIYYFTFLFIISLFGLGSTPLGPFRANENAILQVCTLAFSRQRKHDFRGLRNDVVIFDKNSNF